MSSVVVVVFFFVVVVVAFFFFFLVLSRFLWEEIKSSFQLIKLWLFDQQHGNSTSSLLKSPSLPVFLNSLILRLILELCTVNVNAAYSKDLKKKTQVFGSQWAEFLFFRLVKLVVKSSVVSQRPLAIKG